MQFPFLLLIESRSAADTMKFQTHFTRFRPFRILMVNIYNFRIQQEQLEQIFKLMEKNKEKYGISSIDDVQEQMKRYKTL